MRMDGCASLEVLREAKVHTLTNSFDAIMRAVERGEQKLRRGFRAAPT